MGKVQQLRQSPKPGARGQAVSASTLSTLEPLRQLPAAALSSLAQIAQHTIAAQDTEIFCAGDMDPRVVYLLEGEIRLLRADGSSEDFDHLDLRAKSPIAAEKRRTLTATAVCECKLLIIPHSAWEQALLDLPASSDGYEVDEIDTADGATWIHNFLKSPVFLRLPAGNIQKILSRFEEVKVQPGQLIIKQGSQANNFYVVKEGRFKVSRRTAQSDCVVELATLHAGDGFGEDAIISHGQRNASVTAITEGTLMRLGREDFIELLAEPVTRKVSFEKAESDAASGSVFLDVRSAEEFNTNGLRNALNIPLSLLRANMPQLDSARTHIVYCNNGLLSSAAAFLLSQHSKKAVVLEGGLQSISAKAPARRNAPLSQPATAAADVHTKATAPKPTIVQPQGSPDEALRIAAERELAELMAKIDVLEENLDAPTLESEPLPLTIEDIVCVDRDDSQLWTPIPGTTHLSSQSLAIAREQKKTAATRNPSIVCVGEADAIFWEPVVNSRSKPTTEQEPSIVAAAAEEASPQRSGWISDNYLWETVIGYSPDAEIETSMDSLLAQAEAEARQKLDPTPKPARSRIDSNTGTGIHSVQTKNRDDAPAPAAEKPHEAPKTKRLHTPLPLWRHVLYGLGATILAAVAYVSFFPNHELNSQLISLVSSHLQTIATRAPAPEPTPVAATPGVTEYSVTGPALTTIKARAASEFTVKKHFAVEAANAVEPVPAAVGTANNDTRATNDDTVFGLTEPAAEPFDSFVVPAAADQSNDALRDAAIVTAVE